MGSPVAAPVARFRAIDQTRGAVMVLMALDHARWFFTNLTFQPEDLAQTNLALFLTRWVTHYCAPGFFLLAGMGIFLYGSKRRERKELVAYLLSRGLMLVLLELTIVGFSWRFVPGYSFGGVIWALGWSFLAMAALVLLPRAGLLVGSLGVLLFHNVLDGVSVTSSGWGQVLWRALYHSGTAAIPGLDRNYYFLFSLVPWLAMMALGYAIGPVLLEVASTRRRFFVRTGLACIAAFAFLRATNLYGNPASLFISESTSGVFSLQSTLSRSLVSFLNAEKYPPSLQFALMTLGPILLWLGWSKADAEGFAPGFVSRALILFGRVPLFFYLLHLYLIHLLAIALGKLAGRPVDWLLSGGSRTPGSGFDLWVVYLMWFVALAILYPACRWYGDYKKSHSHAWLKYL